MRPTPKIVLAGAVFTLVATTAMAGMAVADGRWSRHGGGHPCGGPRAEMAMLAEVGDRDFSADEIRTLAEARLLMIGNDNLKVGDITATERGSYLVQIVTQEDSLVREVEVSKATGRPVRSKR